MNQKQEKEKETKHTHTHTNQLCFASMEYFISQFMKIKYMYHALSFHFLFYTIHLGPTDIYRYRFGS